MIYKYPDRAERIIIAKALRDWNKLINRSPSVTLNAQTKTYIQAVELFKKVNIVEFFGLSVGLGENMKCAIVKSNIASVNRDEHGEYRYFSNSADRKSGYCLSLLDMYQVVYNCGYYKSIYELCKKLEIKVKEGDWAMEQKIRYADNIATIEQADDEMRYRHPSLYKFICKHLYVLEKMNALGLRNLASKKESVNGSAVFFASSRFVSEELEKAGDKTSASTVAKILNAFAALGLLKKVAKKDIPGHMRHKAIQSTVAGMFEVNFYTVPEMGAAVLAEADRRADKLKRAGITMTTVSADKEVVEGLFGIEEVAKLEKVLGKRVYASVFADTQQKTDFNKSMRTPKKKAAGAEQFDDYNF